MENDKPNVSLEKEGEFSSTTNETPTMQDSQNIYGNPTMYGTPNMQGGPAPYYPYQEYQAKSDGYAVASLVLGILSLLSGFFFGIFGILFSIPAMILAFISKSKEQRGRMPSIAIGGLITGILGFLIACIIIGLICYILAHMNDTNSLWYFYMRDFMNEFSY